MNIPDHIKIYEYAEEYLKSFCPECDKVNWTFISQVPPRVGKPGPEPCIKCWHCGTIMLHDVMTWDEDLLEEIDFDHDFELGLEHP